MAGIVPEINYEDIYNRTAVGEVTNFITNPNPTGAGVQSINGIINSNITFTGGTNINVSIAGSTITISFSGTLALANGGLGATTAAGGRSTLQIDDIAIKKSNLSASAAPTVNDDSSAGYAVGSVWCDTTADDAYICLDASVGAAVWKKTTP